MPSQYVTNELPSRGSANYFLTFVTPAIRQRAERTAFELLEWLIGLDMRDGDFLSALLIALLLRHHDPSVELSRVDSFAGLRQATVLDVATSSEHDSFLFAPFEKLLDELREKIAPINIGDR